MPPVQTLPCSHKKLRIALIPTSGKLSKRGVQDSLGLALEPYLSLAKSLNLMAASLRSGLQVPTVTAIIVNPPLVQQESPSNQGSPREEDDNDAGNSATPSLAPPLRGDIVGNCPKHTYVSIQKLYNKFYGLGEFKGKPVAGGLAKLEEIFKTKWRQGFSGRQKKEWSQLTQTIVGINVHIVELGGDEGKALDNLNVVFRQKLGVNHTTSKMVKHMQESGLLVKGTPRGRYAAANRSAV